ncbi:MAG: hypothetical protein ACRELY_07680, partial [Polyangiaceae bacterium]
AMRDMSKFRFLAVFSAVFCLSAVAHADDQPSENIRLTYGAPPGCPSRQEFVDEVDKRGVTLTQSSDPSARAVSIAIDEVPGWHGHFSITTVTGESSRDVSGSSCEEVARSLAIFASLAIGPNAAAPDASAAETAPATEAPRELPPAALPMAPPPEAPPPDLLEHRFSLALQQGTFFAEGADAWGGGLRGAYSPTSSIGFNLEADGYRSFSGQKFAPAARFSGGIEVDFLKNQKPLVDLFHANFDVYFLAQAGVILTRPTPLGVDYPYKPSLDVTAGLGFRYFVSSWFALDLEEGIDIFSHDVPEGDPTLMRASSETLLASTSWIGLTFYFSKPTAN